MTVNLHVCINEWFFQIMFITTSDVSLRLSVFNNEANKCLSLCNLNNTCDDDTFENALMAFSYVSIQYDSVTRKLIDIQAV